MPKTCHVGGGEGRGVNGGEGAEAWFGGGGGGEGAGCGWEGVVVGRGGVWRRGGAGGVGTGRCGAGVVVWREVELAIKAVESRLVHTPEICPSVRRQSNESKGEW